MDRRKVIFLGTGCCRCGRVKEHGPSVLAMLNLGRCRGCGRDLDDGDCVVAHTDNAFRASDGSWQMYGFGRRAATMDELLGAR